MYTLPRSDGLIQGALGAILLLFGGAGVVLAVLAWDGAVGTFLSRALPGAVTALIGVALLLRARTPLLRITSDGVTIPGLMGPRTLPIKQGTRLGLFRGPQELVGRRASSEAPADHVHLYLSDPQGRAVHLISLHQASPELPRITEAFDQIAGLEPETLRRAASSLEPDTSHWRAAPR